MANSSRPRHAGEVHVPRGGARQYGGAGSGSYAPYISEYSRMNYGGRGGKGRKKKHTGLKVFAAILAILLILAGVAGFCGYQLYQSAQHVRSEASGAMSDLRTVKSELVAGNMEGAQQAARSLSATAAKMSKETDETLWMLAEKIPVYGEDITTVRAFADVLEDVSANALVPLCDQLTGFSLAALVADDGAINVDMITNLVNQMSAVSPVIERGAVKIESRPEPHLSQVKSVLGNATDQFAAINDVFVFANRFAPHIADVLGANGTRSYLIVAQNNVEARCTGGFYGSAGMATVDNGRISIGDFSSLHESVYDEAYTYYGVGSTAESNAIVEFPSTNLYNLGINPDVPHVAQLFSDACAMAGRPIDGLVLVDPIFVQYMVGLTGGFTASNGTWVDGANAAAVLMHDTYWTYFNEAQAQDAFFTMVANDAMKSVFNGLGSLDMKEFAKTLMSAGKKRHFSLWFSDSDEQAAAAELSFSGAISTDPTEAVSGVYFTNNSWSKMEWYLRASTEVTSETKNSDGTTSYGVTLSLYNAISDAEVYAGNWYVTGGNGTGNKIMYQSGDMLEMVFLLAPAGGYITDVWTDGDVYNSADGYLYDNEIHRRDIHLLPGQTVTFTYTVVTSPEAEGPLEFDMSPLAQEVQ